MAAGVKMFALVLAPLVLARARARHWILFGATLVALCSPFAIRGGTDLASLLVFAREWEFNSATFGLLANALRPFEAKLVLDLMYAAVWARHAVRFVKSGPYPVPRGNWLYGALLVISPVINPWYLLWLLPFAAIFPSAWAGTGSASVLLSYVTGINLNDYGPQPYQQPTWARSMEFGLILLALVYDLIRRRSRSLGGGSDYGRVAGMPCTRT